MINRTAISAMVLLFAIPATAGAGEVSGPVRSAVSWTGIYIGIDGGYRFVDADVDLPSLAQSDGNTSPDSIVVGGEIGFRYQLESQVVLGLSGDIKWLGGNSDSDELSGFQGAFWETESDYDASVQASLGYAFDRALIYVQGGVAFTEISGCGTFGGACVAGTDFSGDRTGWTVGLGLAYALTDHLSANIEYRYSDYGTEQYTTPGSAGGETRVDLTTNTVTVGVQYKF